MCNPILRPASGHLWGVENDRGVGHRRQRVQLGRAWTSGLCAGQCRLYNMHRSQSAGITGGIRPYRRVGLASPNRRASTECSAHWSFEACAAAIQSTLLPESWPPEPTASELRPVRPGHRIPEPVPWVCGNVYHMRMARVNITVPDELYDKARSAGLNVSRVAQDAIRAELARLGKIAELDAYLAELEVQQGPLGDSERAEARAWADGLFGPPAHSRSA